MKEIQNYLFVRAHTQKEGRRAALATVVHVECPDGGRPGVRSVVSEDEGQFPTDLKQNKLIAWGGKGLVLLEPLEGEGPLWLLEALTGEQKDAVLVTLFSLNPSAAQPGTSLLYKEDGILTDLPGDLRHRVLGDVRKAARERASCFMSYGSLQSFIEFIPARVTAETAHQKHVF